MERDEIQTFQLEPSEEERFYPSQVRKIVEEAVKSKVSEDMMYNDADAQTMALQISEEVRNRCKTLRMPRYKIAIQTIVGELSGQGIRITSKQLWSEQYDNYTTYNHTVNNMYVVVMVFGTYFE